jgi:hypothetical protein
MKDIMLQGTSLNFDFIIKEVTWHWLANKHNYSKCTCYLALNKLNRWRDTVDKIWKKLIMVYPRIYLDTLNEAKTSVKVINIDTVHQELILAGHILSFQHLHINITYPLDIFIHFPK